MFFMKPFVKRLKFQIFQILDFSYMWSLIIAYRLVLNFLCPFILILVHSGEVSIGSNTYGPQLRHWRDMTMDYRKTIACWHMLGPKSN